MPNWTGNLLKVKGKKDSEYVLTENEMRRRMIGRVDPEPEFHLEFLFPNLWQNHIARGVRVVVAFAPVDEERTLLYLRFYQSFVKIPVLRRWVCRLAMPYNRKIVHQDRRVVVTQVPKRSEKCWMRGRFLRSIPTRWNSHCPCQRPRQ